MAITKTKKTANDESAEDSDLMIAIRDSGDVVAFRTLYDKYSSALLGLSYKIVGNRALAEDVVQETFWRIWQNAARFDPAKGRFTSWMFGIGRNLSIDVLRKNKRLTLQPIFDEQTQNGADAESQDEQEDVADLAWAQVRHREIRAVIHLLPAEQRDVLFWIYFQGKTRREIAAEQNIPFGTINTRARLALKKLHTLLNERGMGQ